MTKDLYELADKVIDEKSFLIFLDALAEDWNDGQTTEAQQPSDPNGAGANGWENGTIGTVLEAASAWGQVPRERPENTWTLVAHILHAGKFYE